MNIQKTVHSREAVKLGSSRQVVIPKRIHDALGLTSGDYLEVELRENWERWGKPLFTEMLHIQANCA